MPKILSHVARRLGLLVVHVTVVRRKSGSMRVIESKFPPDSKIDVGCALLFTLIAYVISCLTG